MACSSEILSGKDFFTKKVQRTLNCYLVGYSKCRATWKKVTVEVTMGGVRFGERLEATGEIKEAVPVVTHGYSS